MLNVSCINQTNRICQPTRSPLYVAQLFVFYRKCGIWTKSAFQSQIARIFSGPRIVVRALCMKCNCKRWRSQSWIIHRNMSKRSNLEMHFLRRHESGSIIFSINFVNWIIDDSFQIFFYSFQTLSISRTKTFTQQIHQSCHNPIWLSHS